jgi:hypothetical protein
MTTNFEWPRNYCKKSIQGKLLDSTQRPATSFDIIHLHNPCSCQITEPSIVIIVSVWYPKIKCLLSTEPRRDATFSLGSFLLYLAVCSVDALHGIVAVLIEFSLGLCEFRTSFVGL